MDVNRDRKKSIAAIDVVESLMKLHDPGNTRLPPSHGNREDYPPFHSARRELRHPKIKDLALLADLCGYPVGFWAGY